jgi:hypothetical protein
MGVLHLQPAEHDALRILVAAGSAGAPLGRKIPLSAAVRLEDLGLADVVHTHPCTARATGAGQAFFHRSAL